MLAVKAVLALDDAGVQGEAQLLGGLHQGSWCTWKSATAGNSMGAYSRLVCSYRMAPVATTTSPDWTFTIDTAAGAGADERVGTAFVELLP